jgi:hypothetical protein
MLLKPILSSVVMMGLLSIFGINLAGSSSTGYYSVPAADFKDASGNVCNTYNYGNQIQVSNVAGCTLLAGVHLPDGVTITKVTMYWYDSNEEDDILGVFEGSTFAGWASSMAILYSNQAVAASSSSVNTSILIDNANNEYYLRAIIPANQSSGLGLIGFRLDYTTQTFLSRINR